VSGADGIGDTEGKAATGSGERAGTQASFKFVSRLCSQKNSKKACHLFTSAINPGRKKEKVLTRFWHFRYKQRFTL
jgi:hypothetical protein